MLATSLPTCTAATLWKMTDARMERRTARLSGPSLATVRESERAGASTSLFASVFVFGSVSSAVLFVVIFSGYPLRLLQIGLATAIGIAAERAWVVVARRRRARRGAAIGSDYPASRLPMVAMFVVFAVVFIAALLAQHAIGVPWLGLQLAMASAIAMGAEWAWVVAVRRRGGRRA